VRWQSSSFAILAAFGGRICHFEQFSKAELIYGAGQALFRPTDRLQLVANADASHTSQRVGLTISGLKVAVLLGKAEAAGFRHALEVAQVPGVAVRWLSATWSALLRDAITLQMT